jgi:methylenetetrahydrofolate dehydrogenase (NADP+) / methenyltetrahydrofolate cyclohydrolase
MTTIIDGRKIRDKILTEIKKEVALLSFQPVFCDVLVGEDPASVQYVEMKARVAESVGIIFRKATFPKDIKKEDLVTEIKKINETPNICGIIVQLPLPENLNKKEILDAIDPRLDVDCLGSIVSNKFYSGDIRMVFPTALACVSLLESLKIDLKGKKIVVLGEGELVGKPVSALLRFQGLKIETLNHLTENKEKIIKEADVVISGMGNGKYLKGDMIKPGSIIIDAGTSESNSSIVGDVDFESVKNVAGFVSPVPGGVGPVTVAMLLSNVLQVAKNKN